MRQLWGRVVDEVKWQRTANDEDFADGGDFGDGAEAMLDNRMAGHFEERFGNVERKRTKACTSRGTADLEKCKLRGGLGGSHWTRIGRTRMTAFVWRGCDMVKGMQAEEGGMRVMDANYGVATSRHAAVQSIPGE